MPRCGGALQHKVVEWENAQGSERQRNRDPFESLLHQFLQPSLLVNKLREETAEHKEQRHTKTVDPNAQKGQDCIGLLLVNTPRKSDETRACVQNDAENHCRATQGV